jgi:hypothetical protein
LPDECSLPARGVKGSGAQWWLGAAAAICAGVPSEEHAVNERSATRLAILVRSDAARHVLQHFVGRQQVTTDEAKTFEDFVPLERWRRLANVTFIMTVSLTQAMKREQLGP